MLKCRFCKKEINTTINDYCYSCYYNWFGFDLITKISLIIVAILLSAALGICIYQTFILC